MVEAVRQGAGGRRGLVIGQGVGRSNRKSDGRYIAEVGHGVPRTVLEGPKPVHEGRLCA